MAMGYCDLTRDDDPITSPAWSVYTLRAMAVSAPKSTERPVMREGIARDSCWGDVAAMVRAGFQMLCCKYWRLR